MSTTPTSFIPIPEAEKIRRLLGSPLRLALVSILRRERDDWLDLDGLSRRTGRMKSDVENCLQALIDLGLIESGYDPEAAVPAYRYRPAVAEMEQVIETILAEQDSRLQRQQDANVKYFEGMIGTDEKMLVVFEMIHTVAKSDISALILGPTGTGKELVAHAIHDLSPRVRSQFHAINCASLPENLFEAELFGYEKGSFTSAHRRKIGRLELADGGTLFLDEIGELSLALQVKLLRVLESRTFERIGGTQTLSTNFRLICATNRSLEDMVSRGEFREDLYYRINVFPIRLPSLKERPGDIPILAREFLKKFCMENDLLPDARCFSDGAIAELVRHEWAGNIRELENVVQRVAVMASDTPITPQDLKMVLGSGPAAGSTGGRESIQTLKEVQRQHVIRALGALNWNIKAAAETLGISRVTLYKKIKDYGIERV
ncbi:MAG: sigma 54-interacting transcriptional regulator [Acidobacteriota bacterium]